MGIGPDSGSPESGVAAVDRALAIVKAVATSTDPMTLAEMSHATGFYKSTLLRLLASLDRAALVIRLANGRYALGSFSHQLGCAYEASYHLSETVLPVLEALVAKGTESASFHVYHDATSRQCLLRVDSNHSTVDRIRVGDLLPLNRGAAGRLLTAYLVQRRTPSEAGLVFLSVGERDPNCAAVACPVFGPEGLVRGAISLSGPKERFTPAAIKKMSQQALAASKSVSHELGGRWPSVK